MKNLEMEMIPCTSCSNPMPKLRKELYGYTFCIKCSTVLPKVGRTVTCGQGDHTWNETEILDQEVAKRILELEQITDKNALINTDLLDFNEDSETAKKYRSIGSVREIIEDGKEESGQEEEDLDDFEEEEDIFEIED